MSAKPWYLLASCCSNLSCAVATSNCQAVRAASASLTCTYQCAIISRPVAATVTTTHTTATIATLTATRASGAAATLGIRATATLTVTLIASYTATWTSAAATLTATVISASASAAAATLATLIRVTATLITTVLHSNTPPTKLPVVDHVSIDLALPAVVCQSAYHLLQDVLVVHQSCV
jgi:hypothetical protein